jgi:hypothetical protein
MARVISNLPNQALVSIGPGGVKVAFTVDRGESISEEITDELAAYFASVPGYRLVETKKAAKAPPAATATSPAADAAADKS